jgi:general secretion pathway protein D
VKKTVALLLVIGLVNAPAVFAQETAPTPSASSGKTDAKNVKANDDFVTLNFTNIDIGALVKVMSELTHRNFLLDERVTGKVTIMTPEKISPEEAYQVFLSALEIKGFTAIEDGKVTRIIPAAMARQSGLKVFEDGHMQGEGYVTKLIRLNYVNPQEIVRTLAPLITKDGTIIAYPTTNSIIITDSVSNIRRIESLLHVMDVAAPEGKGKINVYYLKNANSEDMGKLMQALVSRLPVPPAGGMAPVSPSTILEGPVNITSDKATNSLIIVASPGDYETVKDVIQKLDIRRRQVYVEVAIIEMSLAKQRDLGFEFQAANLNQLEGSTNVSTIGGTNFGTIGSVVAGGPAALASMNGLAVGAVKGTFKYNGVEYLNIGALLHALETDGDVNVLSTPNILTMDNQKAEIMVGENIPFVTGQSQTAATAGSLFTQIDRRDVGITLKLTPQIASDDNVRLEVYQEISDITQTPGLNPNIVGPSTSKRSASTTVMVKDRQTMVIGGLIRDNVTSSTSKVPFLGDIPILGWFFKSKTTRVEKTNLMIFITPYIIKNEGEAGDLTRQKNNALEDFRKEYRIEKKSAEPVILSPKTSGSTTAPASSAEKTVPELKSSAAFTTPAKAAETPVLEMKSNAVTTAPAKAAPATSAGKHATELKSNAVTTAPANVGPVKEVATPVTELKSGMSATAPTKTAPVQPETQPVFELKSNAVPSTSATQTTQLPAPSGTPKEGVR